MSISGLISPDPEPNKEAAPSVVSPTPASTSSDSQTVVAVPVSQEVITSTENTTTSSIETNLNATNENEGVDSKNEKSSTVSTQPTELTLSVSDTSQTTNPASMSPNGSTGSVITGNSSITVNDPVKAQFDQITDMLLNSIGDVGTNGHFKMLVYGDPGSTKSSFLGTAPNNLIYDMEDGLSSIKTAVGITGRQTAEGLRTISYKSMFQAEELIKRLDSEQFNFAKVFSIDSLSDLHKKALQEVMEREWRKRPSMNRYVPETEHYTEVNELITRFVRSLRDLDKDIIVLAHAQTVEPKNKPAKTYPDFSEKLANKVEAMMDIVAHMAMRDVDGKIVPVMRVVSDGTVHAKTRIPLPAEILNPDWRTLKEVWTQHNS